MDGPIVYDKAKWHYEGKYPKELSQEQAFVHTGMYLGWIIDHGLFSDEFAEDSGSLIEQFKARQIKASAIYKAWDGCLVADMLSEEGNVFSQFYFDFKRGRFLGDYEKLLAVGLPTVYHVEESWMNYDKLRALIDRRYAEWKAGDKP